MPENPEPTPTPTPTPPPEPPAPPAEPPPPAAPPAPPASDDEPLGEAGIRALVAERERANAAEKKARSAERKAADLEREKLSEVERLKADAEEGRTLAATATERLRSANMLMALHGEGITGQTARAAIKLLEGVEFNADEEPTNLDARLAAAKAAYGEQTFGGATPPAAAAPAASPALPMPGHPSHPDFHGGVRPPAPDAEENEQFARYMEQHFPQTRAPVAPQSQNGP